MPLGRRRPVPPSQVSALSPAAPAGAEKASAGRPALRRASLRPAFGHESARCRPTRLATTTYPTGGPTVHGVRPPGWARTGARTSTSYLGFASRLRSPVAGGRLAGGRVAARPEVPRYSPHEYRRRRTARKFSDTRPESELEDGPSELLVRRVPWKTDTGPRPVGELGRARPSPSGRGNRRPVARSTRRASKREEGRPAVGGGDR